MPPSRETSDTHFTNVHQSFTRNNPNMPNAVNNNSTVNHIPSQQPLNVDTIEAIAHREAQAAEERLQQHVEEHDIFTTLAADFRALMHQTTDLAGSIIVWIGSHPFVAGGVFTAIITGASYKHDTATRFNRPPNNCIQPRPEQTITTTVVHSAGVYFIINIVLRALRLRR